MRDHRDDVFLLHFPAPIDFGADGRRVQPTDDLVRQMQMPHVARRQVEGGVERLVEQADRVVSFEPRPQVIEDAAGLLDARLADGHAAKTTRQRLVLLDVFLVLAQGGRGHHADFAAREHRLEDVGGVRGGAERRAGADHRVRLVDEQNQVRPLFELADHVLNPVLEHPPQHRPRDHAVHLKVDDLAVAQANRDALRLELDAERQPFGDRGLADPRLADQHHRIGALAVAQDFQHLLDFLFATEHRRQLVLAGEQVQVRREMFEERRQLEALLQPLFAQLHVAHPRVQSRHQHLRLDAVAPEDRHGHALRFLEYGGEQVGGFNRLPAGPAGVMKRQLEDQLCRRRHAELASRKRRHHVQVLFDRLKNGMRIDFDVPHDFREHVPFDLCKCEKNMLVGQ